MRRPFLLFAALLIACPLLASTRSVSFDDRDSVANDCSAMSVRFDGQPATVVAEDIPVGNPSSLRVRVAQHGAVRVIGTEGGGYAVRACKAAASGGAERIRVRFDGHEVSATGPEDEEWAAYFIVQTPRNANLDVEAANGPVSVRDFDGTLAARVKNGPLSLRNPSGTIDATAMNGPISIAGGSGNVKLAATNGPISVKLEGRSWDGGSLDASTKNGPVSLQVPRGFRSGVLVEALGHGPVSCRAGDCPPEGRSFDERPRRIELGNGATVVHLSSVNGPVSVNDID